MHILYIEHTTPLRGCSNFRKIRKTGRKQRRTYLHVCSQNSVSDKQQNLSLALNIACKKPGNAYQ